MELNKEIIKRLGRLKTGDLDDGMAQLGIRVTKKWFMR